MEEGKEQKQRVLDRAFEIHLRYPNRTRDENYYEALDQIRQEDEIRELENIWHRG